MNCLQRFGMYVCMCVHVVAPFPPSKTATTKKDKKTNCCIYTHCTTYMIRFKKNLLLAGLWFGRSKPTMSTFLKPLMDHLKTLSSIGTFPIQNLVHVTCIFQVMTCTNLWHMLYAGSICIYMHVACIFHVTCMDLGLFHACYMHVTWHAYNMRKTIKD